MTTEVAVANQPEETGVLGIIQRAASDPTIDVAKMQALLDMQLQIMAKQELAQYNEAMTACQAEMERVAMTRENSSTKSKFANIGDVDAVARPVYTKHGFALSFSSTENEEGHITMTCTVRHKAGHTTYHTKSGWRDDKGPNGTSNKTRIQGSASTGSYLRRYLTCEVFNIVTGDMVKNDNDGNTPQKEPMITSVQRDVILKTLDKHGKTAEALCKSLNVQTVADIPLKWFDSVISRIKGEK